MYSERFDPAPPHSRENSACYPYANPSNLKKKVGCLQVIIIRDFHNPPHPEFFSFWIEREKQRSVYVKERKEIKNKYYFINFC